MSDLIEVFVILMTVSNAVVSDAVLMAIIALIGGMGTGLVMPVVMFILKERSDRRVRQEEREERAELARLTHAGLEAVKIAGGERETRIMNEVKQVKQVAIAGVRMNKEQIVISNGVNDKIASLGQQLVDGKDTLQQVEIMNTPDHPVPVEPQP